MQSWSLLWQHQHLAMWLIVVILAVLIALFFWRGEGSAGSSTGTKDSPEAALKRRYANGEIDEPTYEHMLQELRK